MKYTLPDVGWAGLLWGIAKDAPVGALVEVYTPAMLALAQQRFADYGRVDIVVRLVAPPGAHPGQVA